MKDVSERAQYTLTVMALVGTFLPYGFQLFRSDSVSVNLRSSFWYLDVWLENDTFMTYISIYNPLMEILMWGFQLIFVYCVYRHTRGLLSRRKTILYGVLTHFVLLSLFFLSLSSFLIQGFRGMVLGPVPLLLLIGFLISYFEGKEPPTKPWDWIRITPETEIEKKRKNCENHNTLQSLCVSSNWYVHWEMLVNHIESSGFPRLCDLWLYIEQ